MSANSSLIFLKGKSYIYEPNSERENVPIMQDLSSIRPMRSTRTQREFLEKEGDTLEGKIYKILEKADNEE
jgi:hypothetical protein